MTLAEFEKYAKEHNIFYCTKELQEKCDDAVSRQAIKKLKRHNLVEGQFVSLYDIEQLPSVRPQEQTGMSDAVLEHYKKLAEHYNGGKHESIQDTDDGK